jgi:hypothetical protein
LFELLDHPLLHIVESALSIIEHRGYEEAIPLVRHLTMSNRKKSPNEGGFVGTTAELAELVLNKLVAEGALVSKLATETWMLQLAQRRRKLDQLKDCRHKQILKINKCFPEIVADFRETLVGESTFQTGGPLFSDEEIQSSTTYFHLYRYEVNQCTYQAAYNSHLDAPPTTIILRYRIKNPADYIFDDS